MRPFYNVTTAFIIRNFTILACFICLWANGLAQKPGDTLKYPIKDRYGDPYGSKPITFDFTDTAFVKRTVEYDAKTNRYYVVEKIGSRYYRTPASYSMEEFLLLQGRKDEREYFRRKADMMANMNKINFKPQFKNSKDWYNRIIGNGKIDIKPTGYVDLFAGYQGTNTQNPTLPERARKNGGPDFDMNMQFQMNASIGDKLKLPINYNTLANFGNQRQQLNLNYNGKEDDVVKEFVLGNTTFTTKSTLIQGAQSLFGAKTKLQFGKLFVTGVIANQQSQRMSLNTENGAVTDKFKLHADEYEENRHFLLGQYFRNNYNKAMSQLPIVRSPIRILRMEAWVTNRMGVTVDTRDIVALMDLGEGNPYLGPAGDPNTFPSNDANNVYRRITGNPSARNSSTVTAALGSMGFTQVQDFEKTFARKLLPNEYYFNPQVGFISLLQPLLPDEVLGVAYQYAYNGRIYQVGEFSQDIPPDSSATSQRVLFLKLLKATSQRTSLPLWDLMMKNVYSVGYGQLDSSDFKLDVVYEEASMGTKRYMPLDDVSPQYKGYPLISLLNLDRLNSQKDPQPDGVFDFLSGFTIIPSMSRVIFPVLEPFGHDLDYIYATQAQRDKYLFYPLYDTIKAIAQTYANLNRFQLTGKSKSTMVNMGNIYSQGYGNMSGSNYNQYGGGGFGTGTNNYNNGAMYGTGGMGYTSTGNSGEYQLASNLPRNSVTVTAGGKTLTENVDFQIDYERGMLKITDPSILNSGVPVNIQYESDALYGMQQKNFRGLRLDYLANEHLTLGATAVRLAERPYYVKQSYGEEPIKNSMYGFDLDYKNNLPRVTKWLNKLPFYQTKAMSSITAYAEGAIMDPGHPKQIGKGPEGASYIDDFEGSTSTVDLRFPLLSWNLASVPQGNGLFAESALSNDLRSGMNRAKLAWYNIEPVLQDSKNPNNPVRNLTGETSKPEVRQILQQAIFPNKSRDFGQTILTTFDLAYYPKEKGPYNFESRNTRINSAGNLVNPREAWGGIMRSLDQTDLETANIEYLQFWVRDPFGMNDNSRGGKMYINLGNLSEDILKDGKKLYENGLPGTTGSAKTDTATVWGRVPSNPMQLTNAFSTKVEDRDLQDVGFDGYDDDGERNKFKSYLSQLQISAPGAYNAALKDPSGDDFKTYRDASYDAANAGILQRYKNINNPQGNSPVNNNSQYVTAFTQYPDVEDLNRDNTLQENEEYFQYKIDLRPNMFPGSNFITDVREDSLSPLPNGRFEKWYLFRVPLSAFESRVGRIPDFKSIRFMRMFLTGFDDSVVLRFGRLEMVRNQWRKYSFKIDTTGNYVKLPLNDPVEFNQLSVNVEENDQRQPVPYRMPPGVQRQQDLSNNNVQLLINEQALSVQFCGLPNKEARGVFKTLNMDMRRFGKLKMFVHAEGKGSNSAIADNSLTAVVRISNDFQGNFYEVRIPLRKTNWGATDTSKIWPSQNYLDFDLQKLIELKTNRNKSGRPATQYFSEKDADGKTYAIIGNPNLGEVRGILLAVENTRLESACAEVWFNELRLTEMVEDGGYAALARVNMKLADLGTLNVSGSARTHGFGTLDNKLNQRIREDIYNVDVSTDVDAGKLLPKQLGLQVPTYLGVSKIISLPEYDPYDLDIKLKDKMRDAGNKQNKDSIRKLAMDVTTIKTVNLTNVRKMPKEGAKPQLWSISNFDVNYSFIQTTQVNPLLENYELRRTRGGLGYSYAPQAKPITPFKYIIKSRSPWLNPVKDFNFSYLPSLLSFRADLTRQFGATRSRNVGGGPFKLPETYDKYFTFDRFYILQWNLTQSLSVDFNALNNARVDEPYGRIDQKWEKDSIKRNLFNGGRNTKYAQQLTVNYNVPLQKIPALDWTSLRLSYRTDYNWLAASLIAQELGNTMTNTQSRNVNGQLNFEALYNKSRFLRAIGTPAPPKGVQTRQKRESKKIRVDGKKVVVDSLVNASLDTLSKKEKRALRKELRRRKRDERRIERDKRKSQPLDLPGAVRFAGGLLTSVKNVNIQYSEEMGSTLPGYMDSTRIFGSNLKSGQPGARFLFGYQPDSNWINGFGRKGLLSRDTLVTALIEQRYNQRLDITAQISPIRDLNIDIDVKKTYSKNYSELYKDTSRFDNVGLTRLTPYAAGSFSVSYISYQTLFRKSESNEVSQTFKEFEAFRQIISKRLGLANPYGSTQQSSGYYSGYGRYAQDVVIPSFLAAYTKKDPNKIGLFKNNNSSLRSNAFSSLMPKPNWTLTYNGLSKLPFLQDIVSSASFKHAYHSELSLNSFNSALLFQDPLRVSMPYFRDTLTGNYVPFFLVPNVTIQEQFDPLLQFDLSFKNGLSAMFEYRKTRQLSLSLLDYQLAENRATEFTTSFDWRARGVPLIRNLKFGKKDVQLQNDINFHCLFSLRDDVTSNTKLDQGEAIPTRGQKVITIQPSIDYILNKRVSLKLFMDQSRFEPKGVATTFKTVTTRGGLQIRVSLAE